MKVTAALAVVIVYSLLIQFISTGLVFTSSSEQTTFSCVNQKKKHFLEVSYHSQVLYFEIPAYRQIFGEI
jgi:hypothetical protein